MIDSKVRSRGRGSQGEGSLSEGPYIYGDRGRDIGWDTFDSLDVVTSQTGAGLGFPPCLLVELIKSAGY